MKQHNIHAPRGEEEGTQDADQGRSEEEEAENKKKQEVRVGDVVTFSYKNANAYPPVGVAIERVRGDLEWRDVVLAYLRDAHKAQHLNSISLPLLLLSSTNTHLFSFFFSSSLKGNQATW